LGSPESKSLGLQVGDKTFIIQISEKEKSENKSGSFLNKIWKKIG
jgi:hypothetical protein